MNLQFMRGLVLVAFGILYLMKPDLFRSGIFMKYANPASTKTPEEYRLYMKKVALVLIIIGSILLAYDYRHLFLSQSKGDVVI